MKIASIGMNKAIEYMYLLVIFSSIVIPLRLTFPFKIFPIHKDINNNIRLSGIVYIPAGNRKMKIRSKIRTWVGNNR
jgi:hypothetical protein